jgi:hypothetical protein
MRLLAALIAAAVLVPDARAREVAGVAVPDSASLGGKTLPLHGAGLRKRLFVKVYVGALYLESHAASAEAVVAADAPKLVRMHFLRDVGRGDILKTFREGFERNSKATAAAATASLAEVEKVLPAEVKTGQVLLVSYVPGTGTALGVEGGASATVEGKEFADALFRVWMGPEPADADLKAAMLGR